MKHSLIREKLKNLDSNYTHPSYIHEKRMISNMKLGLLEDAKAELDHITMIEKPSLANGDVRSLKNSLIASCTLYTRAAISAGVSSEDAFDLSDVFINHIETLITPKELKAFEYEMLEDFVLLIKQKKSPNYAYPISNIIKTIYENPTEKYSTQGFSETYNLSSDYLSKLFKKEVGEHLTEYIQRQKIELAKNYLEFSQMKITDIACLLNYCNTAYFTNVFTKYTGMPPSKYRKKYS